MSDSIAKLDSHIIAMMM